MTYLPDTTTPTNGASVKDPPITVRIDEPTAPPALHMVERHPEDPPLSIEIAVGQDSLIDPDETRVNAAGVGKGLQAVDELIVDELLIAEYDGLRDIRKGAVESHAISNPPPLREKEDATDAEVEAIVADGVDAADTAERLEKSALPHLTNEVTEARKANQAAEAARDEFEDEERKNPQAWEHVVDVNPVPAGGPLHWLQIAAKRAALLAVFEVLLGALVLSGPIGDAMSFDFPYASALVAGALSLTLNLLGWFSGKALAAVELPVRAIAAIFVAAAVLILLHATVALDALRVGHVAQGKTILTTATLASIYCSTLTSYAASIYGLWERRRAQIVAIPTPIELWRIKYARLNEGVATTHAALMQAIVKLEACLKEIEARKAYAGGTDERCRLREAEATTAKRARETIEEIKAVHLAQEDANGEAAIAAARMAYEKARAEVYPDVREDDAAGDTPTAADADAKGLSPMHVAAIVALIIGAIGGLLGSQIALTLGAAAAAVLLLLGMTGWTPALRRRRVEAAAATATQAPTTSLPGDKTAPGWKELPSSTTPKHGTAGTDPTQHH